MRPVAAKAYFLRSLSTEAGMAWQARRWSRFMVRLGVGALRQARRRSAPPADAGSRRQCVAIGRLIQLITVKCDNS